MNGECAQFELKDLPLEILLRIFVELAPIDITILLSVCQSFNELVQSNGFWRDRTIHEFPELSEIQSDNWKEIYFEYLSIWGCGDFGLGDYKHRLILQRFPHPRRIRMKQVAVGSEHTVALDFNGTVWVIGNNSFGQLGIPIINRQITFVALPSIRAKSIYANNRQSMFIDLNDNILACGNNHNGQLGLGPKFEISPPELIRTNGINFKVKQVALGITHSLFIDLNDDVWGCGGNLYGQLGLGHDIDELSLQRIPEMKAQAITAGENFSALIDLNGAVWVFGRNKFGQLGLDPARYGRLDIEGRRELSPVQIPEILARKIAAGGYHLIVVDPNQRVWSTGWNYLGELGLGNEIRESTLRLISSELHVAEIASGLLHTVILDIHGNLWLCGGNYFGQLGLNDTNHRNRPTIIKGVKARAISAGFTQTAIILSHMPPVNQEESISV